jgi:hypothetical protein
MNTPAPGTTATGHAQPGTPTARTRPQPPGQRRANALVIVMAAAVVACAAPPPRSLPPAAPPATTARTAPGSAAAGRPVGTPDLQAVEQAYRRFWDVAQDLDQNPEDHWRTALADVAADPVLSRILDGLHRRVRAGYRQYGTVVPHLTVVELGARRASVLDCQDASATGEIDTSTGLLTNRGRAHTPITATLTRGDDARWRLTDASYLPGDC